MKPIGPLMREHRLIERMIRVMERRIALTEPDPAFLTTAVDFMKTFVDQIHHGKEEDILFRDLKAKTLSAAHRRMLDELVEEHVAGRNLVKRLDQARTELIPGDVACREKLAGIIAEIAVFYKNHIDKEDNRFFYPCLDYFSPAEQEKMLRDYAEYEGRVLQERYLKIVESLEAGTR
ncbi:hemerythrin domain-containing protein [Dehalogenimonas sp. 4OHTPN]|uniref:Hemerythrin domain-containing protein n=1 Tax=Dehalogenimonas sp. 4OHTPN TaxID=3166643 RepID=A0AAU8GDN5_9CHLR